jgi:beta-galactosidase
MRQEKDPLSGTLPWDQAQVRKLLVEIPHEMHWNSFRFCIGPVPDRWLEIAEEAGLLIQNEYFVWTGNA